MQSKLLVKSLGHLASSRFSVLCGVCVTVLLLLLGRWMTDFELSFGNLGKTMFYAQVIIYILFCLLFGVFVAASVYKITLFGVYDKKNSSVGTVGGFIGILVAGCPACAVSVASYIGLASVLALLPRNGLELKILGIGLVGYATRRALITMEVCELRRKPNSAKNLI